MPRTCANTTPDEDERLGDETTGRSADLAPGWLVDLRRSPHRKGFYQSLGDYALVHMDRVSGHLMVSFDNLSSARDESIAREPWGYGFVARNGWSQLGVLAFTAEWFRDAELFRVLHGFE